MDKSVTFLHLNIYDVLYVLLWIKCWLMWFESLLAFILFKFKKCPHISGIRVVYSYKFKPKILIKREAFSEEKKL